MTRNGFRVFDSDTHVGPYMDVLSSYLSEAENATLAHWEDSKRVDAHGRITYTRRKRHYRRRLGEAEAETTSGGYMAGFTGVRREKAVSPRVDHDPAARIADMDYEGVDVNLTLPSGWFGTWTTGDDVAFELAMYRAYHRWMQDYCGAFPNRLGGVILGCARGVAGEGEAMVAQGARGGGGHALRAVRCSARSPGLRADLGRSRRARPRRRAAHLHRDAAVRAGRSGHLGQPLAPALCRASLVRHAQHGGADRQRRDGSLSRSAHRHARGGARLVTVLDGPHR